jgi:thioredoxin 1
MQVTNEVIKLTSEHFDKAISSGVTLVDFWAEWCGPCRIQGPILDDLAKNIDSSVKVTKLNVDDHQDIAGRYGIRSIPTILIFKDGEVAEQFVGVQEEKVLKNAIDQLK